MPGVGPTREIAYDKPIQSRPCNSASSGLHSWISTSATGRAIAAVGTRLRFRLRAHQGHGRGDVWVQAGRSHAERLFRAVLSHRASSGHIDVGRRRDSRQRIPGGRRTGGSGNHVGDKDVEVSNGRSWI